MQSFNFCIILYPCVSYIRTSIQPNTRRNELLYIYMYVPLRGKAVQKPFVSNFVLVTQISFQLRTESILEGDRVNLLHSKVSQGESDVLWGVREKLLARGENIWKGSVHKVNVTGYQCRYQFVIYLVRFSQRNEIMKSKSTNQS